MRLLKLSCAIPALLALSACKTHEIPPIADSACVAFARITYAVPPVQADGTRNVPVDEGNRYDTTDTVGQISKHNARYEATCR